MENDMLTDRLRSLGLYGMAEAAGDMLKLPL